MMKKMITILLATMIAVSLAACGSSTQDSQVSEDSSESSLTVEDTENETVDEDEIETVQVTTNGYTYSVPSSWEISSETDDSTKFIINGDKDSIVLVQAEDIPDIMKVDTGSDSAILAKEDVPNYFMLDAYEVSSGEWKSDIGFDYYDAYFDMSDGRLGRIIVVPINETEAGFSITIIVNDESYLDDIDVCLSFLFCQALNH